MDTELAVNHTCTNVSDQPRLFFFSELDGAALLELLGRPGLLELLSTHQIGIALSVARLDAARVEAVRLLNAHRIPLVAWLLLPPEQGFAFNLQNYPQAHAQYEVFRTWAVENGLHFDAVGLEIEVPPGEDMRRPQWGLREMARRLWLAGENILYPAARVAYTDLLGVIRHDGYEVHSYQMPLVVDDRSVGTTVIQRALDILDLPGDVDVLMCSSCVPNEDLDYDLGGALIASYGPAADAIGIGSTDDGVDGPARRLPWPALRRDLLLAAKYTDTIFVFSLEDCIERDLLRQIVALDWRSSARPVTSKRLMVGAVRCLLLAVLVFGRFGPQMLAWGGWLLAAWLWWRNRWRR